MPADPPGVRVKICGMTSVGAARHAAACGADYVGLVFFPPSPRSLSPDLAREIAASVPPGVAKVALTVNADDDLIAAVTALGVDWLQLHGKEPPERVAQLKARTGLNVMKAIGIRDAGDLDQIERYSPVADQLLIDAKPPQGAAVPGGHGVAFDWRLIAGRDWELPWMLAGGLDTENVAEAIRLTGATQVDVASGTESAPGVKDLDKIAAFIAAAKGAGA